MSDARRRAFEELSPTAFHFARSWAHVDVAKNLLELLRKDFCRRQLRLGGLQPHLPPIFACESLTLTYPHFASGRRSHRRRTLKMSGTHTTALPTQLEVI